MPTLSHSQKRYELRLQDEALLVFTAARDTFGTVSVSVDEVVTTNLRLLPLPLWPDSRSGERLLSWLETRVIPKNRRFVDQILAQAVVTDDSTFVILDVCLDLSVNDAYWVVPHGFEGTWADYNLFENDLDEVLALVAYTGYTTSQRHNAGLSGEWTTDGQFPKAWRRVDGELCLYKGGTEGFANSGMEPYSEFFAAQAAEAFAYHTLAMTSRNGRVVWPRSARSCTMPRQRTSPSGPPPSSHSSRQRVGRGAAHLGRRLRYPANHVRL